MNQKTYFSLGIALTWALLASQVNRAYAQQSPPPSIEPLTAMESLQRIRVPEGYRVELVAAEPMIEEPVMCTWDANGRMYVAEMRSFMQDTQGTGAKERTGRIKRLEDTDHDGVMDRVTIFAEQLLAPRMILPLDDRVIIQESGDSTLYLLRDTNGDGVADERQEIWKGGPAHDSIEHQDSGLLWNLDNWLYTAEGGWRHRFTRGKWETEKCESQSDNQWGLGMDDVGNLFFSHNSFPGRWFQQPWYAWSLLPFKTGPKHPRPRLGQSDTDEAFHRTYPIHTIGDRVNQPDRSFTSACGISIYRGNSIPKLAGHMLICEPCSHLVRCAQVEVLEGKRTLQNAFVEQELFASADFYSRPVWTVTGPDGCIYVVDMYRGIIQDKPWVDEAFAKRIVAMGADQVKQRGRIWRIVPADAPIQRQSPQLLAQSPPDWLRYLEHANGFWRDAAQRLLVLSQDRSVVEPLIKISREHSSPLARLHALWTLEGLDSLTKPVVYSALRDQDARVRAAAVRLCEPWLKANDTETHEKLRDLVRDHEIEVLRQLILSLGFSSRPEAIKIIESIVAEHLQNEVIYLATMTAMWGKQTPFMTRLLAGNGFQRIENLEQRETTRQRWKNGISSWKGKSGSSRLLDEEGIELVHQGGNLYLALCATCHGIDGQGVQPPGGEMLAPPLDGSIRVQGQKERLIRILLHGLEGDLDGKRYRGGVMAPMGHLEDAQLAALSTYIRQSWTNDADPIRISEVAAVRRVAGHRATRWTQQEFDRYAAPVLADSELAVQKNETFPFTCYRGYANDRPLGKALNANPKQRGPWIHGQMVPGHWFAVDMLQPYEVTAIELDASFEPWFPRSWELRISPDGQTWSDPIATGQGSTRTTTISVEPTITRYFKITQTAESAPVDKHGRRADLWDVRHFRVMGRDPNEILNPTSVPTDNASVNSVSKHSLGNYSTEQAITKTLAAYAANGTKAEVGAALFQKLQCAGCHATKHDERLKGPHLGQAAKKLSREELITAILEPSKKIAEGFQTHLFALQDGKIESGFILSENDSTIQIRNAAALELVIRKSEIEERSQLEKVSLMPAGIVSNLTAEELASLVLFIQTLTDEKSAVESVPANGAPNKSTSEKPSPQSNAPPLPNKSDPKLKLRALIIDGENNHDFRGTTDAIRGTLASTGRFGDWSHVRYSRSPLWWERPEPPRPKNLDPEVQQKYEQDIKIYSEAREAYYKQMRLTSSIWEPPFSECDVVIVNYNGNLWPEKVREAFVQFVRNGGGAVVVHAANNAFESWPEYNEMLGIGWRGPRFGHWIAVDDATGKLLKVPEQTPQGSSHGDFIPFKVKTRAAEHPIMQGLPLEWMHGADELYVRMRGVSDNLTVLATAQAPGTKQHEPVIWCVPFGKGRVVTTSLGHYQRPAHYSSLNCVGFQTLLARSCEWAATGEVTIPVPADFPMEAEVSIVPPNKLKWKP
jgi:putative heme-binding domain-containing protein